MAASPIRKTNLGYKHVNTFALKAPNPLPRPHSQLIFHTPAVRFVTTNGLIFGWLIDLTLFKGLIYYTTVADIYKNPCILCHETMVRDTDLAPPPPHNSTLVRTNKLLKKRTGHVSTSEKLLTHFHRPNYMSESRKMLTLQFMGSHALTSPSSVFTLFDYIPSFNVAFYYPSVTTGSSYEFSCRAQYHCFSFSE
jgi:hypothetical protein